MPKHAPGRSSPNASEKFRIEFGSTLAAMVIGSSRREGRRKQADQVLLSCGFSREDAAVVVTP